MGFWKFVKDSFMEGFTEGWNDNARQNYSQKGFWNSFKDAFMDGLEGGRYSSGGSQWRPGKTDSSMEKELTALSAILDMIKSLYPEGIDSSYPVPILDNPFWEDPTEELYDDNAFLLLEALFAIHYVLAAFFSGLENVDESEEKKRQIQKQLREFVICYCFLHKGGGSIYSTQLQNFYESCLQTLKKMPNDPESVADFMYMLSQKADKMKATLQRCY